ncbi:MAG: hypothetical protein ACK4YP_27740, partial [Myxococcota bacterium]
MAKKNDAKRAAKKHAKEKKRQKKVAEKRATMAVRQADPLAHWKPALHGVEGLARMLQTDSHDASVLADHMAKSGRKDAKEAWIPSRVAAFSTEALVAELATRGVVTEEATFVAAAEGYQSARQLAAEVWGPLLAETATVHDRDLVGQAAEVLWERWIPGRVTDETLRDRLRDVHDLEDDGDATLEAVEALFGDASYARLARAWDEARLDADLYGFFAQSGYALKDPEAAEARVARVLPHLPPGGHAWEGATLCLARLADHGKRAEEAAAMLMDAAEAHPQRRVPLLAEAADILAYMEPGHPLTARALALLGAAADALDGDDRELMIALREE